MVNACRDTLLPDHIVYAIFILYVFCCVLFYLSIFFFLLRLQTEIVDFFCFLFRSICWAVRIKIVFHTTTFLNANRFVIATIYNRLDVRTLYSAMFINWRPLSRRRYISSFASHKSTYRASLPATLYAMRARFIYMEMIKKIS